MKYVKYIDELNHNNLINYIIDNDIDNVKVILKTGINLNIKFPYKDDLDHPNNMLSFKRHDNNITFLMLAAQFDFISIVKELLKYNIDLEIEDDFGSTVLNRTTHKCSNLYDPMIEKTLGSFNLFKLLIKAGAKINVQDGEKNTPLYNAADYNQLNMIKELIINGADLNIKNEQGNTALLKVAYDYQLYDYKSKTRLDIIRELIKAGADLTIKNNEGETFFDFLNKKNKNLIISEFPKECENYFKQK
ncbi:ankyrin repeat domain-containing protein [Candidatus Dojkabacteria bacterium]|jgi:ankyrin repeat protein|nr:ankyrin repeat domain-containing protein [Candidatus Dojkabacteria bacterium]